MKHFLTFVFLVLALFVGATQGLFAGCAVATLGAATLMPVRSGGMCFAVGPLNLLDLALRSGKAVHALIQGVLTVAAELANIKTLPIDGLTYETLTCVSLPSGDFRKVGEGVGLQKSEWRRDVGSMVAFEAQMRVPEDILISAKARNKELTDGDILASEAIRHVQGSAIKIGAQTWYGSKISKDGFAGLSTQVDAGNILDAGGAANADSSSVYLVDLDADPVNPQGVHYLLGNGGKMNFKDAWLEFQVQVASDPDKFANVFANNFLAFLGLVVSRKEAIYKVKNVVTGHPFTDLVATELVSKIPLALRMNKSRLRWFMNTRAMFLLHQSRIQIAENGASGLSYVPEPTDVCGIPIVLTDSLVTTERAGLKT